MEILLDRMKMHWERIGIFRDGMKNFEMEWKFKGRLENKKE